MAYSKAIEAIDGSTPYKWNISEGALPAGLALNATTGTISGTPTTADSYSFTVKVTDSAKPTEHTVTRSLTIAVATAPVKMSRLRLQPDKWA